MHFIVNGDETTCVNLCYAIAARRNDGTEETRNIAPDELVLTVYPGDVLRFKGDDAENVLREILATVDARRAGAVTLVGRSGKPPDRPPASAPRGKRRRTK